VESTIGRVSIDSEGSPVAILRLDPSQAYCGFPALLKSAIDEPDSGAWQRIKAGIDYVHCGLDDVLGALDRETAFSQNLKVLLAQGRKLLFKPNLVSPICIDPDTHGEGPGAVTCTEWSFVAAVMRSFHDRLNVSYHDMAVGEAASVMSAMAGFISLHYMNGAPYPTEALMEGTDGKFYGGWGFYFVRKYLAESHDLSHVDDPMSGYAESISGTYLRPGRAAGRLMVYDLNRIFDDPSKGRDIPVPDGVNFGSITVHKVVAGGDPTDPSDMQDYPGCVLVNLPKLKIHTIDLVTNAIKNLGIGLYPQEAPAGGKQGSTHWKYAYPWEPMPGLKTEIPHAVWVPEQDEKSAFPLRDEKGWYRVRRTGGMSGTQTDIVQAVQEQGVFMLHIVDAIETINISHSGGGRRVPEGFVMASTDPVAVDHLCARYCVKNVPVAEAREIQKAGDVAGDFIRRVPVPAAEGGKIVTRQGYDSVLTRYNLFAYAERRGAGRRQYYVLGKDTVTGLPLVSVEGHLGRLDGNRFEELLTSTLYYADSCFLWDMQKTALSYAAANDALTGSSYLKALLDAFDENGDGMIDYDESGRKGFWHVSLRTGAWGNTLRGAHKYGFLKGPFLSNAVKLKCSNRQWNAWGQDWAEDYLVAGLPALAFNESRKDTELDDPFVPGLKAGKGQWPSMQFAIHLSIARAIYGSGYPARIALGSLYGQAFQYADKTLNGGAYTGSTGQGSKSIAIGAYFEEVEDGKPPLDFVLYVPPGYLIKGAVPVPNVEETADLDKTLTATFTGGSEVWKWAV